MPMCMHKRKTDTTCDTEIVRGPNNFSRFIHLRFLFISGRAGTRILELRLEAQDSLNVFILPKA